MLSVENPPPDPSCPCDVPQLKDSSDESAAHKLALSEVDLAKQPLFDGTHLPKFSIRDYVFTARRKDIKRNWPFSLKNLQLCLNHGVKDLLPPFQPLEAVRSRCTVENENIISNSDGELSVPDHDRVVLDSSDDTHQLNGKLADVCNDITISCRSEGENDFPSTITSVSQSEIEESVPTNGPGSLPFKTDNSLGALVEVEAEAEATCPPVAQKTESSTRTSSKKCRLVVKFSTHSDRSSTEDIASICTHGSETMASKICPVCKTFSSSSNTTLNAHIDQCLSVESTPKGTVESKLTRRSKPRKTRLMVDIYSTAAPCTLEDLDRRNGSSWALVSSFTPQDIEKSMMPAEDKKQRMLPVHPDVAVDVGPVYIDANGTKLRILSKFDDAPSVSKVLEHLRPRKPLKGGKGNKFLTTKKKKCHASKYHKYLKLTSQSKKLLSSKVLSSQICRGQERYSGLHESYGKGGRPIQKQLNHCNSGNLRQWVCSKRTGVAKKLNNKVCRQPFECKWHVSQDLRVENDQSYLHDSLMDESSNRELMNLSGKQISSPKNTERIENVFYEGQNSDQQEQSLRRKRAGNPLFGASIGGNAKGLHPPMKRNASQLRKNSTTRNGTVDICADPIDSSDLLPEASTKQSRSCHFSRSKAKKISSLRKNSLSFSSRVSLTESESTVTNKYMVANIDEEIVAREYEDQPYDFMHNCAANQSGREAVSNEMSLYKDNGLEIRQKTGVLGIPERKEVMVLENSQVAPECYQDDGVEITDAAVFISKVDSIIPAHKEVRWSIDDLVTQPSSKIAVGKTVSNFLSMDPKLKSLGDQSKIQASSLQRRGPLCEAEEMRGLIEPTFIGRQEMFCADEVGNGMVAENVDIGEELDSKVGQESSFPEVDPIPIPGPPGSFLPSPRDMGSEDFQGNSSLTTSRVQSSQDQHDFVDGDSSDSPVSEASTISNFTATRCDPKYCEPLSSVGPKLVQERVRSSLSGGSLDSSVENAVLFTQTTSAAAERLTSDGEKLKVNKIPLSFKGDDQPCCCQRKERDPQGVTLNYQGSQLLRRRAMGLVMVPAMEKQFGGNMDTRLEGRSETFYPSSCSTSKSEKVALPVVKCPASPNLLRDSVDVGVKFSGRNDCDSTSPSSSNSILRLMGKNLMVVNRDEDESMPHEQAHAHTQINHLTSQFPTFSGVSPSNVSNQVYHSFFPNSTQGSIVIGQDQHNTEEQCFDARYPSSFRTHASLKKPHMLSQGPGSLISNQHKDSGFMAPIEPHDYKGDENISAPQHTYSKNRPIVASTSHMERVITIPDCQHKNALSTANPNKEIIIIDDVSESEADLISDVAKYSGGLGENHVVSSGTLFPSCSNSTLVNPLPCYHQLHDHPSLRSESPVLHNTSFNAVTSRRANTSYVRWSRTPEGSCVLQQSPHTATSSARGHMRSALYNSSSLL